MQPQQPRERQRRRHGLMLRLWQGRRRERRGRCLPLLLERRRLGRRLQLVLERRRLGRRLQLVLELEGVQMEQPVHL